MVFLHFFSLISLLWVCICIYFDLMYIYRSWRYIKLALQIIIDVILDFCFLLGVWVALEITFSNSYLG